MYFKYFRNTLTAETLIAVQKYATSVYCMTPKRIFNNTGAIPVQKPCTVRFSTILCCNMTVKFYVLLTTIQKL